MNHDGRTGHSRVFSRTTIFLATQASGGNEFTERDIIIRVIVLFGSTLIMGSNAGGGGYDSVYLEKFKFSCRKNCVTYNEL